MLQIGEKLRKLGKKGWGKVQEEILENGRPRWGGGGGVAKNKQVEEPMLFSCLLFKPIN
jgi:hypothetical protein